MLSAVSFAVQPLALIMANSTSNPKAEKTRERVWSWLSNAGYKIQSVGDIRALWKISAQVTAGPVVLISQIADSKDAILIQSGIGIGATEQQRLGLLDARERRDLLYEIVLRLLELGVQFEGVEDPLVMIAFEHPIYLDGLTQDAFLQRMWQVFRAVFIVKAVLDRKLDQPPAPSSGYVM